MAVPEGGKQRNVVMLQEPVGWRATPVSICKVCGRPENPVLNYDRLSCVSVVRVGEVGLFLGQAWKIGT